MQVSHINFTIVPLKVLVIFSFDVYLSFALVLMQFCTERNPIFKTLGVFAPGYAICNAETKLKIMKCINVLKNTIFRNS